MAALPSPSYISPTINEAKKTIVSVGHFKVPLVLRQGVVRSYKLLAEQLVYSNDLDSFPDEFNIPIIGHTEGISISSQNIVKREYVIILENGYAETIVTDTNLGIQEGSRVAIVYIEDTTARHHPVGMINYRNHNSTVFPDGLQDVVRLYMKNSKMMTCRYAAGNFVNALADWWGKSGNGIACLYTVIGFAFWIMSCSDKHGMAFLVLTSLFVSLWVFALVGVGMFKAVSQFLERPFSSSLETLNSEIEALLNPNAINRPF